MTGEIQNSLGRIEEWQGLKGKQIDRIESAIYGNGKNGLKVKVDRNTRFRKGIIITITLLIAAAAATGTLIAALS